ncbi:phage baseplate assembly protein V [Bartonella bilalgolemii]|uniref:Phage baseplate assembly protein V n=1 Tax=Bartonella bilalgolemii TaxID=2942911 RepID=A0ABT0P9X8_9HYPH|nr:phage baseplate assembly protein V [Bartonella sp. G70]MCL6230186.1 phage baseplate assembly protein V [Bartonella sp. G70]
MLERRNKEITDLKRRVANMVVVGKISHVDYKNARYRVKSGNLVSDWIPDTQARAGKTRSYEGRDVGEQVVVLSSSGDLSQGVIVGSIHTDANQAADNGSIHRTIYPDGTSLEYDDKQNSYSIHIKSGGKFILTIADGVSLKSEGGELELTAPDGIKIVSESDISLNAKGNISLKADSGVSLHSNDSISFHSGNNISINSSNLQHNGTNIGNSHVHGGVSPGGSMTGGPN